MLPIHPYTTPIHLPSTPTTYCHYTTTTYHHLLSPPPLPGMSTTSEFGNAEVIIPTTYEGVKNTLCKMDTNIVPVHCTLCICVSRVCSFRPVDYSVPLFCLKHITFSIILSQTHATFLTFYQISLTVSNLFSFCHLSLLSLLSLLFLLSIPNLPFSHLFCWSQIIPVPHPYNLSLM